jgi:hypothetical protein
VALRACADSAPAREAQTRHGAPGTGVRDRAHPARYAEGYIDALSDKELAVTVRFLEVATEVNQRRADELREDGS